MAQQDDFYIGWQEEMPDSYKKSIRRFIMIVAAVVLLIAATLVLGQRGFADSVFELGKLSQIEGTLQYQPVPSLLIPDESSPNQYQRVILIGFGKFAAEATLQLIEEEQGTSLDGQSIILEGTKIYHRGKILLELTKGSASYIGQSQLPTIATVPPQNLGNQSLLGEIYDPKCALGVMKPGYGKPHRSCAIRCISGGIPPVLHTVNTAKEHQYYLLKGPDGQVINQAILEYVADQVRICGRVEQQGDWKVMYINPDEDILRLKPHWMNEPVPLCDNY